MAKQFHPNPLRRGQAIAPFGIGAMVEFPRQCLMAAGLDSWDTEKMQSNRLSDSRLGMRLGVDYFLEPPPAPDKDSSGVAKEGTTHLPFVRFPLWHYCPACRVMEKLEWNSSKINQCSKKFLVDGQKEVGCGHRPPKKRPLLIPVSFVKVCSAGHIEDFPFFDWCHKGSSKKTEACNESKLKYVAGGRAGLQGVRIECVQCGSSRSMAGSFSEDSMKEYPCSGLRPWLGPEGKELCAVDVPPLVTQRGASNVYFPRTVSSILVEPESKKIARYFSSRQEQLSMLQVDSSAEQEDKFLAIVSKSSGFSKEEIRDYVKASHGGADLSSVSEEEYRLVEYKRLGKSAGLAEDDLVTTEVAASELGQVTRSIIEKLVKVEKVAETRALVGFDRRSSVTLGHIPDFLKMASRKTNWLPAVRVYGEGIFLKLDAPAVRAWAKRYASRQSILDRNQARMDAEYDHIHQPVEGEFVLLHTLAHLLLRQLCFEAGYGSSSLKERVYYSSDPATEMMGVLIYTAAGDTEGSLGGLVGLGQPGRFEQILGNAIAGAETCSSDPVCVESNGQGSYGTNLAACFCCTLASETSCEHWNGLLDRAAVVGLPNDRAVGFFGDAMDRILDKAFC